MCGIVGFTGKKGAAEILLKGLSSLEYRGYDSAGIAVLENKKFNIVKTVERIEKLITDTESGSSIKGNLGLGHTRWATHGAPSVENSHPHLSENLKFAVVHNGIIENYAALKEELLSDGFKFKSETDTEVIPLLLQKYYKGDIKAAVSAVSKRLEGSYALGIACSDYPETIVAVRKLSPLIIGIGDGCNLIASDVTALVEETKKIIYLDDGETAFLTPTTVEIFDGAGAMVNKKISIIDWDISSAQKGGFEHFMMKEIVEQPDCVLKTLSSYTKGDEITFGSLKLDKEKLKKFKKIDIVACGSAYHAGVAGKYILEKLLKIPVNTELASEFRYREPLTDKNTLTIAISQSGETADTLAALKEAKRLGAHTLAIVNVVGSSLAKVADDVLYTRAGPEIAVATTKGYLTQLILLSLFAVWTAEILDSAPKDRLTEIKNELFCLPEKISKILEQEPEIKTLAYGFGNPKTVFFIGRNTDYAVALEASLKLKEISYIHSESYAAGELKHGTISLIEDGTPVIALCCCERLIDKMQSNIKEVRARGAKVLACVSEKSGTLSDSDIETITIPHADPLLIPVLEVVPFQLFAYYTALNNGCDIDKPRNLAKSVTVE